MFLLISLFVVLVQSSPLGCQRLMQSLAIEFQLEGAQAVLNDTLPYIALSGTGMNRWGDYDACKRKGHLYSTAVITQLGMNPFGFCHSMQCTTQDLDTEENWNLFKNFLNQSGIAELLNIDLTTVNMYLVDPELPLVEHDFGVALTIFILATLFLLSLALPASQIVLNFKTRKYRYQQIYNIQSTNLDSQLDEAALQIPKDSLSIRLLKDFSIVENYRQFINLKTPDPNLSIMNGIRAIAFIMVVYGHQYSFMVQSTYFSEFNRIRYDWIVVFIIDMLYSVDIFFWLGGFFVGFVLFEQKKVLQVSNQPGSIGIIFLHRILRILPCYIVLLMVNTYIGPLMGEGPRWYQAGPVFECKTGWRNILFIDNLFDDQQYCFGWGWYLSNDIQLFVVSLIPLYFYAVYSPTTGKYVAGFLLVATQIIGTIISIIYELQLPLFSITNPDQFYTYYIKPYCRGPPYFLGLLLGICYREYKQHKSHPSDNIPILAQLQHWQQQKPIRKNIIRAIFYISGFTIIVYLSIGWRGPQKAADPQYWSQEFQYFWHAFSRLLFTFGVTLISIPNMLGLQDIFNTNIMNNMLFKYLAKISFTGYLVHYTILAIVSATYYEAPSFSLQTCTQFFIGCFAITCFSAVWITLILEMPSAKLEQRLLSYIVGGKQRAKSMEAPDMSDKMLLK